MVERSDARIFRDQIGLLAQAIVRALNVDDDGTMEETIEQSGGAHGMSEDVAPLGDPAVRGQDHGAALIASVDEVAAADNRQVTDFVDDDQLRPLQEAQAFA
jgi:hypothetical protein